jgi:hypothetical protein
MKLNSNLCPDLKRLFFGGSIVKKKAELDTTGVLYIFGTFYDSNNLTIQKYFIEKNFR